MPKRLLAPALSAALFAASLSAPVGAQVDPHPDSTAAAIGRWRDSRFGIFVHWGPVALKGTEIGWSRGVEVPRSEYDTLYRRFNPAGFNADEWAGLAKEAGARYLTLTTKHHDGFNLWDTRHSSYSIMASPFARDVTKELAQACRRQGIRFDAYYSIIDWYQPDWQPQGPGGPGYALPAGQQPSMPRYVEHLKSQVGELIREFDPGVIWFDGDWDATWTANNQAFGKDVYRTLKLMKPSLIINNRVASRDNWARDWPARAGDYDTPERTLGGFDMLRPWETCNTVSVQWAYRPNDPVRPTLSYIQELLRVVGADGNYLLNIGPGPDGKVTASEAGKLREIGKWVRSHEEGIFGTRGGPWFPGPWGAATHRGDTVYLHAHTWPADDKLVLPALPLRVLSSSRLGGGDLQVSESGGQLYVAVPKTGRSPLAETVRLVLDGRWLLGSGDYAMSSVIPEYNAYKNMLMMGNVDDFAFHTAEEESPSITVDLGSPHRLKGLLIANRGQAAYRDRARTLTAWVSEDGKAWTEAWRAEGAAAEWRVLLTGGANPDGYRARYLKLGLREKSWLHLRNLKIFGSPIAVPSSAAPKLRAASRKAPAARAGTLLYRLPEGAQGGDFQDATGRIRSLPAAGN